MRRPRVVVVGTGGTIAWSAPRRTAHGSYAAGHPRATSELVTALPELDELVDIDVVEAARGGSHEITDDDLCALLHDVQAAAGRADGVVVTHGTATLEETAFAVAATQRGEAPIVVVGSQRPVDVLGSDALLNLYDAVVAAAAVAGTGRTFVCMNRELHDPWDVVKAHTTALDAFRSPRGPVGRIVGDGDVVLDRHPRPVQSLPLPGRGPLPRIDVAYSRLGGDGTDIRAFVAAGAAGIVSAGLLPGITTPLELAALVEAIEAGAVVVQALRVPGSRVQLPPAARDAGVISAGDLAASKARVLLMLALAADVGAEGIADLFGGV